MFYGYVLLYARNQQTVDLGFEGWVHGLHDTFWSRIMASSVGTPVVHMKKMGRSLKVPDIRLENQRPSAPVNKALYEINDFPKNCMKRPSRHSFWFLERWNHHCLLQSGTISNAFKSTTVQEKNTPGFFSFYTIFTYFADQISNLRFFHMHGL